MNREQSHTLGDPLIDLVSRKDIQELLGVSQGPCVSLFMPAHRVGKSGDPMEKEDLIRWKTLLKKAEERLQGDGYRPRDFESLLEPAHALTEDAFFWRNQLDGLAAFLAPGFFRVFRVPLSMEELAAVAPRFHIIGLLPMLEGRDPYYVLALSQNDVRLIEATRFDAKEVDASRIPHSLREALQYDDPEKQTQFRTVPMQHVKGTRASAMYHGHGVGTDDEKDRIFRFCQQVDRGLAEFLRGSSAPLVLAAVGSVAALYRQANSYPHLQDSIISGNPELLHPKDLHERAWPIVEPVLLQHRREAAARYEEWRDTARALHDLEEILSAAVDRRIEALFIPIGVSKWGTFDETNRTVKLHDEPEAGDEDLLNLSAIHTILGAGAVYAVPPDQMPAGDPVGAILRYVV